MLRATLFIVACSAKNRVRRRLRRLREPRYLVGAIVGMVYLAFVVFGRLVGTRAAMARHGRTGGSAALLPAFGTAGPAFAGLALLALAAGSWLLPANSALLAFTPSETAFLFSAPLSRRQLLVYRIVRAQWSVLFAAVIFAVAYPVAGGSARARGLIGMWLVLMTCHLFFTGVTLTRRRLQAASAPAWVRLPQAATAAAVAIVTLVLGAIAWEHPIHTVPGAFEALKEVASSGVVRAVVSPMIALARPLFAPSLPSFLLALPLALLVYGGVVGWVLASDEALDTDADTTPVPRGRPATVRATTYRARPAAWTLALRGSAEGLFVWKGAQQTLRGVDRRLFARLIAAIVWITFTVTALSRTRGLAQAVAILAAAFAAFAAVLGPQILRSDMRQDLANLDVLQTWPIRPAAVVRGEILWPATLVTAIIWALGLMSLILSAAVFSPAGLATRVAVGLAALIAAPAVVLAQYTIHNAVALLFPGWIPADGGRPRGVDALGQRLILLGATWFVLILSLLPAAVITAILWFLFRPVIGPWILIPSAVIALVLIVFEVFLATEALGPAYETLDMTSVERLE
jgi:hypothetical protein